MSWRGLVSRNLQSVKVLACPTSPASAAVRDWFAASYADMKSLNPRFPFMLRPAPETNPFMLVEYDYGNKVQIDLTGLSKEQIDAKLAEAVKAGDEMPRAYHQSVAPFRLPTVTE